MVAGSFGIPKSAASGGSACCSNVAGCVNALATSCGAAAGGAAGAADALATSGGAAAGGGDGAVKALATSCVAAAGGGDVLVDLPTPGGGGFLGGPVGASGVVLADSKLALLTTGTAALACSS